MSIDIHEAAIRLSTKPAVIQKLIEHKILRADYQGGIREADLESLRRNSALLSKVSLIRREVLADEAAANDEQARLQAKKDALALRLTDAAAAGDTEMAKLAYEALSVMNSPVESEIE